MTQLTDLLLLEKNKTGMVGDRFSLSMFQVELDGRETWSRAFTKALSLEEIATVPFLLPDFQILFPSMSSWERPVLGRQKFPVPTIYKDSNW